MAKGGNYGILIVALVSVFVGLPILMCSGCLFLAVIGASAAPEKPRATQPPPTVAADPPPAPAETSSFNLFPDPIITAAEYSNIRTGMTYDEVVQAIGSNGEEMSNVDLAGINTRMMMWKNPGGSNANVTFQDGKVIAKAQFGLQ